MLILERPWTRQPQGAVEVDWSNPLGRSAREIYVPSVSRTLVKGYQTSLVSSATVRPTDKGFAVSTTAATMQGVKIANNAEDILNGATTATIALLRKCADTTARNSTIFGYAVTLAGNIDRVLAHSPFSDGNLYLDFGNSTAGDGRVSVGFTKSTAWETLVFVAGSRVGREVWRNGVRIVNDASANFSRVSVVNAPFYVGGTYYENPGSTTSDVGDIALFVVASNEWTVTEIQAFNNNPWQVLRPRRIYIPTATAAAASTYTLSAATYTNLTATTALPRVTVTVA